jgi:hypothetical protein
LLCAGFQTLLEIRLHEPAVNACVKHINRDILWGRGYSGMFFGLSRLMVAVLTEED